MSKSDHTKNSTQSQTNKTTKTKQKLLTQSNRDIGQLINFQYKQYGSQYQSQSQQYNRHNKQRQGHQTHSQAQNKVGKSKNGKMFNKTLHIFSRFWFGLKEQSGDEKKVKYTAMVSGNSKDLPFQWDDVEIVLVDVEKVAENQGSEKVGIVASQGKGEIGCKSENELEKDEFVIMKCSICLDEITAPRMTKCGHVFCLLCLHRLAIHETSELTANAATNKGRNTAGSISAMCACPLCFTFISLKELKRAQWLPNKGEVKCYENGKPCFAEFELCHRFASSTIFSAVRAKEDPPNYFNSPPLYKDMIFALKSKELTSRCEKNYGRVYVEDTHHILEAIDQEVVGIKRCFDEMRLFGDAFGISLGNSLIDELQKEKVTKISEHNSRKVGSVVADTSKDAPKRTVEEPVKYFYKLKYSFSNVFLHPFNMKCLMHECQKRSTSPNHESYDILPTELKHLKVMDVEAHSLVPEALLQRYTFLSHLTEYSRLVFVEVDLHSYLSSETRKYFYDEFKKRQQERATKRRLEKRLNNRSKLHSTSLKEDFAQLLQEYSINGHVNNNREMTEEVKEFLRSTTVGSGSEEVESEPDGTDLLNRSAGKAAKLEAKKQKSFATVVNKNGFFPSLCQANALSTSAISKSWGSDVNNNMNLKISDKMTNVTRNTLVPLARREGWKIQRDEASSHQASLNLAATSQVRSAVLASNVEENDLPGEFVLNLKDVTVVVNDQTSKGRTEHEDLVVEVKQKKPKKISILTNASQRTYKTR